MIPTVRRTFPDNVQPFISSLISRILNSTPYTTILTVPKHRISGQASFGLARCITPQFPAPLSCLRVVTLLGTVNKKADGVLESIME